MNIGIIDCGGANLNSIYYSFKRLNVNCLISNSLNELKKMDALILPGVGTAGVVMKTLREKNLVDYIKGTKKPILGICIGMQVLFNSSEEDNAECLGLIEGCVKKFDIKDVDVIPQMGWNKVECSFDNTLSGYYYFANSYFNKDSDYTVGYSTYGSRFTSIVKKDNLLGCQFHPEKSSSSGEIFIKHFLKSI